MGSPCPSSTYAISRPRTGRRFFWYGNAAEIMFIIFSSPVIPDEEYFQEVAARPGGLPSPRVTEAASKTTSMTRSGAEYIGLWSTRQERTFAPIRCAMNCCVFGLIMRSSSASKYQDGFDLHPGVGAGS